MNSKLPIELNPLQKTLLITLGGRAEESCQRDSLLHDHYSEAARQRIDFDFSQVRLSHNGLIALAVRAHTMDQRVRAFLTQHSSPMVVHLGCGLDSRVFRINPSPEVPWWEIDFPEVIQIRRCLFPGRHGCYFQETSVLEPNWLAGITRDRSTMIVAEGMFAYFMPHQVYQVLRDIVGHFSTGEILFDAYNRWGISYLNRLPSIRQAGASLRFALDDPTQLEQEVPELRLIETQSGAPPEQIARASLPMRFGFRLAQHIQPFRRMGQIVRYRFGSAD